jgi:hypothetical protein
MIKNVFSKNFTFSAIPNRYYFQKFLQQDTNNFLEPALNDQLEKNKSKEQLGYRSKIEEILLNDYKFLAMIGSENEGVEGVRRLENQVRKFFKNVANRLSSPSASKRVPYHWGFVVCPWPSG